MKTRAVKANKRLAERDHLPGPQVLLSTLYHPALSQDHPAINSLPAEERELIVALHRQYQRWSHKLYFRRNLSARLIAALNGYDWSRKLAACMMIQNPHAPHQPLGRCNLDWYCEFCAYLKGQDLLKKYAGAWQPDTWYELVISLKMGVCIADPNHDSANDVWDAMEAIVKQLKEGNQMQGYVGWLEIAVHSFWPSVIFTPHIHVLLHCDCVPDVAAFNTVVKRVWATWRPTPEPHSFKPQDWYVKLCRDTASSRRHRRPRCPPHPHPPSARPQADSDRAAWLAASQSAARTAGE